MDYSVLLLMALFSISYCSFSKTDTFDETLIIKPLPTGHVYAQFKFTLQKKINYNENAFQHFQLLPCSLGEIIFEYDVQELHFSLTHGLWRYEKWGYPVRDSPPGAELWAVFKGNASRVSTNWKKLTNILSGQFCASLNFIDDTVTAIPKFSFKPLGVMPNPHEYNSSFLRYSSLPSEIVCTENLTPFRKILPCGYQAGLTTLLNALNMFKTHFVSLAVDVKDVCNESCSNIAVQLVHSVAVVFDLPVQFQKQDWSFVKLFGSSLSSTCPVASSSKVFVDITSNNTGVPFTLTPQPTELISEEYDIQKGHNANRIFAVYNLKQIFNSMHSVNIAALYKGAHVFGIIPPPVLYVDRKLSGYGQEKGGIRCTFFNNHPYTPLKIIYFDLIPWYIRLYSHTLIIKSGDSEIIPDNIYYKPGIDRNRPHHLELVITLPPHSKTEIQIDFDLAFLKWTEYPPDANHGFYIGSAVVSALLDSNENISYFPLQKIASVKDGNFLRIHTKILLVSLPTPDFSMPYNVICLTCTVVALAFGPIHNITTRILKPLEEKKENSLLGKLKKKLKVWWKSDKEEVDEKPKELLKDLDKN